MNSLSDIVQKTLDNGYDNNPEIASWTASDLTVDLMNCTDLCGRYDYEELLPHCEDWLIAFAGRP